MVVQALTNNNRQSNGNGIPPPVGCVSKNPEWILMKATKYNYITSMTTHANQCGTVTTWVVLANTTCDMFVVSWATFLHYF